MCDELSLLKEIVDGCADDTLKGKGDTAIRIIRDAIYDLRRGWDELEEEAEDLKDRAQSLERKFANAIPVPCENQQDELKIRLVMEHISELSYWDLVNIFERRQAV